MMKLRHRAIKELDLVLVGGEAGVESGQCRPTPSHEAVSPLQLDTWGLVLTTVFCQHTRLRVYLPWPTYCIACMCMYSHTHMKNA